MFQLPAENSESQISTWSKQKESNLHSMVQLLRALVAPGGPAQVTIFLNSVSIANQSFAPLEQV